MGYLFVTNTNGSAVSRRVDAASPLPMPKDFDLPYPFAAPLESIADHGSCPNIMVYVLSFAREKQEKFAV